MPENWQRAIALKIAHCKTETQRAGNRFQMGNSMLESTQLARSGLEREFVTLEALGLTRPSHVLPAEYLRALTAEGVLDAAAADQVAAAYNRVRYSSVADDDPEVCEAVAALNRVAERLAAMSATDRRQVAAQVCERIQSLPAALAPPRERDTEPLGGACETSIAALRQPERARRNQIAHARAENAAGATALSDPLDPFVAESSAAARKLSTRPRVPVELSAVVALVTFFGGYFFRDGVNKTLEVGDDGATNSGANYVSARDAWKNTELWIDGIHLRAYEEARLQRYSKARVAFELALAYKPDNTSLLNDLASLHLTADEAGTTNPKRALELAERALECSRLPAILDTAAEAQFQCGNLREAIRLEGESLTRAFDSGDDRSEFRAYREKQLKKFQEANQIRTAQTAAASSGLGGPGGDPAKSGMSGSLASAPANKPAGS
jgi:tetratricopeptide (TPR) repeat protein